MKYTLLLLTTLIFVTPAWAADTAAVPTATQPAAASTAEGKETPNKTQQKEPAKRTDKSGKAAELGCPAGCILQTCGGIQICAKKKPAPLCTRC